MKTLARYTLNALTLLSLLACVATAVLWVRTSSHIDAVTLRVTGRCWCSASTASRETVRLTWVEERRASDESPGANAGWSVSRSDRNVLLFFDHPIFCDPVDHHGEWIITGVSRPFMRLDGEPDWDYRYHAAHVPYWSLVALFALLPAIRVGCRWIRRRRNAPGRCATCGYDLRASPGRCPECGTPAKGSA
jgi:hypothetical protein